MNEHAGLPNEHPAQNERSPGSGSEVAEIGPGARLLAERRVQGLSLGDIARQLKLSVRQVEALERDDYGAFAGMIFVRGFLRNYAKLLHVDAEALLARLPSNAVPQEVSRQADVAALPRQEPVASARRVPGVGWIAGLLVLVVLVVAAIYESRLKPAPLPAEPTIGASFDEANPRVGSTPSELGTSGEATAKAPDAERVPALGNDTGAHPQSVETGPQAPSVATAPRAAATTTPPPQTAAPAMAAHEPPPQATGAAPPSGAATIQVPSVANAPLTSGAERPATLAGTAPAAAPESGYGATGEQGQVKLVFEDESWVEIKDATGEIIFAQLNAPGTERVIRGRPPFDVVVGNAHAVRLSYRDRPVDLQPHTRVDVARVVLP